MSIRDYIPGIKGSGDGGDDERPVKADGGSSAGVVSEKEGTSPGPLPTDEEVVSAPQPKEGEVRLSEEEIERLQNNGSSTVSELAKRVGEVTAPQRIRNMSGKNLEFFSLEFVEMLTNQRHNSAVNVVYGAIGNELRELEGALKERADVMSYKKSKLEEIDETVENQARDAEGRERAQLAEIENRDQTTEELLQYGITLNRAAHVIANHIVALGQLKSNINDRTDIKQAIEKVEEGRERVEEVAGPGIHCYNRIEELIQEGGEVGKLVQESAVCFWNLMYLWAAFREDTLAELKQLNQWKNFMDSEKREEIVEILNEAGPEDHVDPDTAVPALEKPL